VADGIKAELGLAELRVEWVPVTPADRFTALQQGKVDLLCGADSETLERRRDAAFSIPIFPGGIGALLRADAPSRLKDVLSGRRSTEPNWRASAGQLLQEQIFTVIPGTTAEPWLSGKLKDFQLTAKITTVTGYDAGVQQLLNRKAHVFFGDRAILLDAVAKHPSGSKLMVLDRLFTFEPLALALARGDEDLRLTVDRTLSRLYAAGGGISDLYRQWFGEPDDDTVAFFRWTTLPN
jgi:putrescine:ornithine antiporter